MQNPRLLIVDDDEELGRLLERTLTGEGFRVTFTNSGGKALELLAREVYELVMLDIYLPGRDGFEICTRIKSNPATADTPVMFITGQERSKEMQAKALAVGGCDYLTKPFSRVDVLARVKCIIHQRMELLRLRHLDLHDGLTGLPGRNYLKARLDEELAECVRFGNPVALILADISALAPVGEREGREIMDRWVERFALLLRSECRRYDVVARFDEFRFALMLPRVNAGGALKAAKRMSETWRAITIEVGGLDFYVPAYMAVECHGGSAALPSGGDLLGRAMTSLDRARQNEGLTADGVIGPTPDPYAVSIWSDYLVSPISSPNA